MRPGRAGQGKIINTREHNITGLLSYPILARIFPGRRVLGEVRKYDHEYHRCSWQHVDEGG